MSNPNRPTATLPPELAERVHVYLSAFLSPAAADEAFREIAEDAQFWGDQEPVQVLTSAHRALESRIRIAPEVEVLVLAEDAELPVGDIAAVLELQPDEVRAMLDEALAALAEPDEIPPARTDATEPAVEAAPSSDWPPALVAEEPEREPEPEPAPEPEPEPEPGPEPEPRSPTGDETAVLTAHEPVEPVSAPIVDEPDEERPSPLRETASPSSRTEPGAATPQRTWVLVALGVAVVLLVAIVIASLIGGDSGAPETTGITCEGAPVCITEAVLTTSVNAQGQPGANQQSFTTDEDVQLWFAFDRKQEGPITLEVRWTRDDEELYRSPFRLAAVDRLTLTLAKLFMEEPGQYGVQVVHADDQVLLERSFAVEPGTPAIDEGDPGQDAPAQDAPDDEVPT